MSGRCKITAKAALEIFARFGHLSAIPGCGTASVRAGLQFSVYSLKRTRCCRTYPLRPVNSDGLDWTMEKVPMTEAGHAAIVDEVQRLKSVERPRIIKAIEEARSHGDLSENAEYHAAKEQQGWTEARVAELEDKLSRAEVIDVSKLNGETVMFGAKVTLIDEDTEDKSIYQIVGEYEADVKKGKLSITSPIARALIGKRRGDSVEVNTPGGGKSYEIAQIKFG